MLANILTVSQTVSFYFSDGQRPFGDNNRISNIEHSWNLQGHPHCSISEDISSSRVREINKYIACYIIVCRNVYLYIYTVVTFEISSDQTE